MSKDGRNSGMGKSLIVGQKLPDGSIDIIETITVRDAGSEAKMVRAANELLKACQRMTPDREFAIIEG